MVQSFVDTPKLRVAIDGRSAQYVGSGVPRYSADLIEVLSLHASEFEFLFLVDENLPTTHIMFPPGSTKLRTSVAKNNRLRDIWEQSVLPRRLARNQVDLFHGLDYMIPWTPCRFARVVTIHDATVFSEHDTRSVLAKARIKLMIHRVASAANAIVTDSDFSAAAIERVVPAAQGKLIRIWPGVSNSFLRLIDTDVVQAVLNRVPQPNRYILYYGGYRRYKNVHLLLHAFARLASSHPHHLVLVGSPNAIDPTYHALITELGLHDRVTIFGYASDPELKALLAHCSLFVFPSAIEGFGLPVVEAMTCGAPVVCSKGGSLPEIAGDAAVYVNDLTPDSLADAMRLVLTNEDLRQQLIEAGALRSKQFQWNDFSRRLADLYLMVVQRCRQSAQS